MQTAVQVIGLYSERDKILRLVQYASTFLAGSGRSRWGLRLLTVAQEIGACRTVLRLFDDVPMLAYTLRYGKGSHEENKWLRILQLISNVANQCYFPLEHFTWMAQKKIINRDPGRWSVMCVLAWATSLLTGILMSLTRIVLIRKAIARLTKMKGLEAEEERDVAETGQNIREQIQSLRQQQKDTILSVFENGADFINAVNWLPAGNLWANTFSSQTSGLLGTISTVIKMYRLHTPKLKTS